MFNKLFCTILLLAAVFTPSFTTMQAIELTQAVGGGNSLTVTHPAAGTVVLHWEFSQPAEVYFIILDDMIGKEAVRTFLATTETFTITGLAAGHYRYKVSNGTEFIIGEDINP